MAGQGLSLDGFRHAVPDRTKRRILDGRVAVREATAALRPLPDFLVIGAMRCGTSSLFKYLAAHPHVRRPLRKEVEFFSQHHARGLAWYRAHFPVRRRGQRTFEASPYYLFHPHAAVRAHAVVPGARLVVLLRDPVERALSHHRHMQRHGFEPLDFPEAIRAEDERMAQAHADVLADPDLSSPAHRRFGYRSRGDYAPQLRRWVDAYGGDRLHVIFSDDLYADPPGTLDRLHRFLGLDAHRLPAYDNHSYAGRPDPGHTSGLSIPRDVEDELRAHYAPLDAELEALIGQPVPWRAG